MTSPHPWRPAGPQPYAPSLGRPPGYPAPAYGQDLQQHPVAWSEGQAYHNGYGVQSSAPWYPQQPSININVSPTMQQSISVHGRPPIRHGLHLVLTLLTGGLWLFVWIPLAMRRHR